MDFIVFKPLKKKTRTYYNNDLIDDDLPYIKDNLLYIPKSILKEQYFIPTNEKCKRKEEEEEKNNNEILDKSLEKTNNKREESYDLKLFNNLSKREPVGLVNIGGVCYMNAVLQCFFYCIPLTKYFLSLDEYQKKNLGLLSKGYYELIKGLSTGNTYAAKEFKEAMMKIDESFIGNEGKDSKDVAILLLSELQNELQENEDSILNIDKNVNFYNKIDVYKDKMESIKKSNNQTIITNIFNFFITFEQRCLNKCDKFRRTLYQIDSDNIMVFKLEKIYNSIPNKRGERCPIISLEDCLKNYSLPEKINCPICKQKTFQIRKVICSLPKILIFVLSRGHKVNFNCKIEYSNEIDMKNYYEPIENSNYNNTKYKLFAATFAIDWDYKGNGHTIALCRSYKKTQNYNEYYLFNDREAKRVNINEIKKTPYLLFYEQI